MTFARVKFSPIEIEGGNLNSGESGMREGRSVASVGAYAPLLRLDRAAAAKALGFSGLAGRAAGSRAVAGWDEDRGHARGGGRARREGGARRGDLRFDLGALLRDDRTQAC